jgi:hypothetical protein
MTRTFAMHQPNYIPYLGYFYKMAQCDVFVYLDAVQFPRGQSFAARNRIKSPAGPQYLTIPVSVPKGRRGKANYLEITCVSDNWKKKHLKTVRHFYGRAPYFSEVFPLFERVLLKEQTFVDKNIELVETFAGYLGMGGRRVRLSEILNEFGRKTGLVCDIADRLGADVYLSGTGGGREYNDPDAMAERGVALVYSDFTHPEYPQLWGDFVTHLSILDVLFNVGREAHQFLRSEGDGHS